MFGNRLKYTNKQLLLLSGSKIKVSYSNMITQTPKNIIFICFLQFLFSFEQKCINTIQLAF